MDGKMDGRMDGWFDIGRLAEFKGVCRLVISVGFAGLYKILNVGLCCFFKSCTIKQACSSLPHTYIHTVVMPPWMQGGLTFYVWHITTNRYKSMTWTYRFNKLSFHCPFHCHCPNNKVVISVPNKSEKELAVFHT